MALFFLIQFLENCVKNISKIMIVDWLVWKSIVFFGICWHFFLRSRDWKSPFMTSINIMFQPYWCLFFRSFSSSHKFDQCSFKFWRIDLFLISFLTTDIHLFSDIQQFQNHILTNSISSLSVSNLIVSLKLSVSIQSFIDFLSMLVSLDFQ